VPGFKEEVMAVECNRCHRKLNEDQSYVYQGKVFCEDCLMDAGLSMKECDPWATYVDKRSGVQPGMKRAEKLTEMERSVYEFVKSRGRVTREDVMEGLGLSETDLKVQLVPLMHSEMVKEAGEGGKQYLVSID
jgi:hypothetical protein